MQNNRNLSKAMASLWENLNASEIFIHSLLADCGGSIIAEQYAPPYTSCDLHRMFSITKSFCSLAIGCLQAEGKISLDDRITGYFPEYCLQPIHPWLKNMTIRHMLAMETCHSGTTYKADMSKNWVESFFITPPTHRSGQIFLYDTSSSHTLAALVKKVTGKGVLDYLREQFLDSIGFSSQAYIITDPFGTEMGGSGLMALPSDLLKTGRYCMDTILKGKGSFARYLREAVSFQVPTLHTGQTLDERVGYGYQFWQIRDGFAMYGMGGQYVLFYPQIDLVLVTTADTQNIKGGTQILLNLVHQCLAPFLEESGKKFSHSFNPPADWNVSYKISDNPKGFSQLHLSFNTKDGHLILEKGGTNWRIPFSFTEALTGQLSGYNQRIATKAIWTSHDSLYLPVQIADESVGSIHILLRLSEDTITVFMRKVEETYFQEFQGFLEGTRIQISI